MQLGIGIAVGVALGGLFMWLIGKAKSASVIAHLDEKERKVLELRFGIYDGTSRTFQEVGDILGLTRQRISQIESKALRHLRITENRMKKNDERVGL